MQATLNQKHLDVATFTLLGIAEAPILWFLGVLAWHTVHPECSDIGYVDLNCDAVSIPLLCSILVALVSVAGSYLAALFSKIERRRRICIWCNVSIVVMMYLLSVAYSLIS